MRDLVAASLLVAAVLAVPLVPLAVLGLTFEGRVAGWLDAQFEPALLASLVIALLMADLVLPVPSSLVSTFAGAELGFPGGTLATWCGMTLAASLGFALARRWGRPAVERLAGADWFNRLAGPNRRYAVALVVLTRALPVVAEASVLLVGLTGLGWRSFLFVVSLSNLGIAAAYCGFGRLAVEHQALPAALVASVVLPLAGTLLVKTLLGSPPLEPEHE